MCLCACARACVHSSMHARSWRVCARVHKSASVCTSGCVFDDGYCAPAAYLTAPLRINKVAKIRWSYIRLGYLLLLLLLYFTRYREAFINLEMYPGMELKTLVFCAPQPLLSSVAPNIEYVEPFTPPPLSSNYSCGCGFSIGGSAFSTQHHPPGILNELVGVNT